jgi:hypothetical protein
MRDTGYNNYLGTRKTKYKGRRKINKRSVLVGVGTENYMPLGLHYYKHETQIFV